MLFLCEECRKAFNLSKDDSLEALQDVSPKKEPSLTTSEAEGDTRFRSVVKELNEDIESSGPEEECLEPTPTEGDKTLAPPSKRTRLEENDSNTTEEAVTCEAEGQPTSKHVRAQDNDSPSVLCSGCLGLLEDSFISGLSVDISEELSKSNFDHLQTFSLSISTPLSLIIRRCGVSLYLSERCEILEELSMPNEAYVKESLRQKLYSQLKRALDPLVSDVESPFQIIVKLSHSGSAVEYRLAAETWPDAFSKIKSKRRRRRQKRKNTTNESNGEQTDINTASVSRALAMATANDFEENDFFSATQPCTYSIEFSHTPIFVGGRYCKYSRALPQTPWFIAGIRKADTSVQELICEPIKLLSRSSDAKFSSSGREDCDVRMLGRGRPFLVELPNPRKTVLSKSEVEALQLEINSSTELVEVNQLQVMTKGDAAMLKEGEEGKRKEYLALIWAPEVVSQEALDRLADMEDLVIHQKTPIRVLHRRTLATRDRTIHTMRGELVNEHHFRLKLTTQAGTYIKEFVHGDFGRTRPNLRTIMRMDVDILTLDVCEVQLDWPPHK